ncbi:hypothetical protein [Isobaculum melis]|uniref:Uncharacterized protein n=1 Tax=Isobaculum melis TaxID=142588 RepID=A0A1H9U0R9_9LACT|nr:hypothetical protein [Isobaculum melis]SES02747.1 hypothetical protein SAMN04488559_1199 [Isobaculum melis]
MLRHSSGLLISSNLMVLFFLFVLNVLTTPQNLWAVFPGVAMIYSASFLVRNLNRRRVYVMIAAPIIVAMLALQNWLMTPDYWWVMYTFGMIGVWVLNTWAGSYMWTKTYTIICSLLLIGFYIGLNIWFEPRFPWSICTTFALVWWPLARFFGTKPITFSVLGSAWLILFLVSLNMVTTPNTLWAVIPAICILWWPLSVGFAMEIRKRKRAGTR